MTYAALEDMTTLWRPMTSAEQVRASSLLEVVSASLNMEAQKVGKDLPALVAADPDAVKITYDFFVSTTPAENVELMRQTYDAIGPWPSTNQEPLTQFTQAAGGYSASGSFLVPGGGLFIKKSELARLGLRRQRIGVIEPYAVD